MAMVPPMAYHGNATVSHCVAQDFIACRGGMPWHATGGTMATLAITATALHRNPTEWHGNPHGTPIITAPSFGLGIGLGLELGLG